MVIATTMKLKIKFRYPENIGFIKLPHWVNTHDATPLAQLYWGRSTPNIPYIDIRSVHY